MWCLVRDSCVPVLSFLSPLSDVVVQLLEQPLTIPAENRDAFFQALFCMPCPGQAAVWVGKSDVGSTCWRPNRKLSQDQGDGADGCWSKPLLLPALCPASRVMLVMDRDSTTLNLSYVSQSTLSFVLTARKHSVSGTGIITCWFSWSGVERKRRRSYRLCGGESVTHANVLFSQTASKMETNFWM